jgi:small subunit ribosomal protein S20
MSKNTQEKYKARQKQNKHYKNLIKNQFKKVDKQLQAQNPNEEALKVLVAETQKVLDRAAGKRVIHKNKAARKKSQLHRNTNKFLNKSEEINKQV